MRFAASLGTSKKKKKLLLTEEQRSLKYGTMALAGTRSNSVLILDSLSRQTASQVQGDSVLTGRDC